MVERASTQASAEHETPTQEASTREFSVLLQSESSYESPQAMPPSTESAQSPTMLQSETSHSEALHSGTSRSGALHFEIPHDETLQSQTSHSETARKHIPPYLRWTSADIAVAATLGVACGLVFWGFNFAYAWLSPILGAILPGIASVLHAVWYFSGTLAVIILRKPGSAVFTNVVGTAAEMLLGNQYSVAFVLISAVLQGVVAEIPFAITRYRRFTQSLSMVSGGLVAIEYGVYLMLFRYQGIAFISPRGIIHMVSEIIGGVLIAGVMSWHLYVAIASTGALDRFASGRALRYKQEQ